MGGVCYQAASLVHQSTRAVGKHLKNALSCANRNYTVPLVASKAAHNLVVGLTAPSVPHPMQHHFEKAQEAVRSTQPLRTP